MQILKVLVTENAALAYRDLSNAQTIVLMRVAAGKTSYDTASEREQAVMDELVNFGLLSDLSYEPTPTGMRVADMGRKHGPNDARILQKRNAAAGINPVKPDGRYTDVGDRGEDLDDVGVAAVNGDDLRSGALMGKTRINRDNAI